jgi:hypothetical protein
MIRDAVAPMDGKRASAAGIRLTVGTKKRRPRVSEPILDAAIPCKWPWAITDLVHPQWDGSPPGARRRAGWAIPRNWWPGGG